MSVTAKFKCTSTSNFEGGAKGVKLGAVVGGSPENDQFFKWTPNATIELSTLNPAAAEQFEPGAEYLVTFEKVVK